VILYFLSKNPDVLAKLRQEVQPLRGKDDLTFDDVKNLPYMEAVMKETGRIYGPTIGLLGREAQSDH
jgi:cytochrome P450